MPGSENLWLSPLNPFIVRVYYSMGHDISVRFWDVLVLFLRYYAFREMPTKETDRS